jgi:hypothetical protein
MGEWNGGWCMAPEMLTDSLLIYIDFRLFCIHFEVLNKASKSSLFLFFQVVKESETKNKESTIHCSFVQSPDGLLKDTKRLLFY